MVDKLKEIPKKLLEWWNKFTPRQKTIIVSAVAGVVVAFAVLATILTKPVYETLVITETTKETATITALLEGDGITYQVSEDGYQIKVLKQDKSRATILLGANDIPADGYGIENVSNGGFSKTESDKVREYKVYMEKKIESDLEGMANIKAATVQLNVPESDGTLLSKSEDSSAAVMITPEGEFTQDNAATIARFVKTGLGNKDISQITIIDNEGNLLFSGDEEFSITGSASSQMSVKQQTENLLQAEVKKVLLGTNEYDIIEVSTTIKPAKR